MSGGFGQSQGFWRRKKDCAEKKNKKKIKRFFGHNGFTKDLKNFKGDEAQ